MSDVGDIARAIEKGIDAFVQWMKMSDKRRLRAGVDIADRIFKRYRQIHKNQDKTISKWIDEFYDRIA